MHWARSAADPQLAHLGGIRFIYYSVAGWHCYVQSEGLFHAGVLIACRGGAPGWLQLQQKVLYYSRTSATAVKSSVAEMFAVMQAAIEAGPRTVPEGIRLLQHGLTDFIAESASTFASSRSTRFAPTSNLPRRLS